MNTNFCLRGRILQIIPVSVYQNVVYTQDIIVEIENGVKLEVFDPGKFCNEELLDMSLNLEINVFVAMNIEKSGTERKEILPVNADPNHPQGPHADIYAYICDFIPIEDKITGMVNQYAVLDTGVGTIGLFLDQELLEMLEKGDYVRLQGARIDLNRIDKGSTFGSS